MLGKLCGGFFSGGKLLFQLADASREAGAYGLKLVDVELELSGLFESGVERLLVGRLGCRGAGEARGDLAGFGLCGAEQRGQAINFLLCSEHIGGLRVAAYVDLAAGFLPLAAGFVEADHIVVELGTVAAELLTETADLLIQRIAIFAELRFATIEVGLQEGPLTLDFGPVEFALVRQGSAFDFELLGNAATLRAGFLPEPFEFFELAFEARLLFFVACATASKLADLGLMVVLRGVQRALGLLDFDFLGVQVGGAALQGGKLLAMGDGKFLILGCDLLAGELQLGLARGDVDAVGGKLRLGAVELIGLLAEAGGEVVEVGAGLISGISDAFGETLFELSEVRVKLGLDLVELLLLRGNDLERFGATLGERFGQSVTPRLIARRLAGAGR